MNNPKGCEAENHIRVSESNRTEDDSDGSLPKT